MHSEHSAQVFVTHLKVIVSALDDIAKSCRCAPDWFPPDETHLVLDERCQTVIALLRDRDLCVASQLSPPLPRAWALVCQRLAKVVESRLWDLRRCLIYAAAVRPALKCEQTRWTARQFEINPKATLQTAVFALVICADRFASASAHLAETL